MNIDNLNDIKKEMEEFQKEIKETKQTNTISYKFFSTKKKIPWLLGGENIHPTPDIQDSYFNFIQLPSKLQFDFITPFKGKIIVNDDDLTYWKVERYKNGVKDRDFYFYTSRVLRYVKNGFEIELSLDIYLTYTRNIINNLKNTVRDVKFNRTTIPGNVLTRNNDDFKTIVKSLRDIDGDVLNGDDTYINTIGYNLEGTNPDNTSINYNKLPIQGKRLSYQNKVWGYFNNPTVNNPNTTLGMWSQYLSDDGRYRSILFNNEVKYTDDHQFYSPSHQFQKEPFPDQIPKNEFLGEMTFLESYRVNDMTPDEIKEVNKNIYNGYFMVFLNKEGFYDCYPILGKIPVKYRVPSVLTDNRLQVQVLSEHQKPNLDKPIRNRVYSTKFTVINGDLNNDFQSMFNEYVINQKDFYPGVDSFKGIFRGIFPGSVNSNIHFVIKEKSVGAGQYQPVMERSSFRFSDNNSTTYQYQHIVPTRMFYRIKQSDFMGIEIRNPRRSSGLFELYSPSNQNFIDNYIELLQPLSIGTTEILPIRYCFLSNTNNNITGYTIPLSIGFMEGFKLFLKSTLYNNPTYNINLGGTLPINNSKYNRMIEQIEIQKNNGISSSIGNLISRPLNWFTGGFGLSSSRVRLSNTDDIIGGLTNDVVEGYSLNNDRWVSGDRVGRGSRNFGGNFGGFGGFIGDFINISNTIKQSEFLKRNVGVGYITTTEDDLFNLVVHNDFISHSKHQIPYQLQNQKLSTITGLKLFTDTTKRKYKYYFENFGFKINDFLKSSIINDVINHSKNFSENVFFSLDKDWCLMNLSELSDFNDNIVKNSILEQLSSGIRMRNFR